MNKSISFSTIEANLNRTIGYGTAGFNIYKSLELLEYDVRLNDPNADVALWFVQPDYWKLNPNQYTVGYLPWESTEIPAKWLSKLSLVNEIWAPSTFTKEVLEKATGRHVKLYPHGMEEDFYPYKRIRGKVLKFLHCGEPAPRKGAKEAVEAFRDAFGNRDDVHLTVKSHYYSAIRPRPGRSLAGEYNNVTLVNREMTQDEMVNLYQIHNVLMYNSAGEGFGLIPFQGMGTGMPVIMPDTWAEYKDFILPELILPSHLIKSPWDVHPGEVFKIEHDDLVSAFLTAADNYDRLSVVALEQATQLHKDYNWLDLTRAAFEELLGPAPKGN